MKPIKLLLLAGVLSSSFLSDRATAQSVPALINYQGRLSNPDGTPLATGDYPLSFSVYDGATNGVLIWGPQVFDGANGPGHGTMIPVVQGYFNVLLGPVDTHGSSLAGAFAGTNRFVEITVSNHPPILPRQQVLAAPYAFQAANAAKLAGADWSAVLDSNDPVNGKIPTTKLATNGTIVAQQLTVNGPAVATSFTGSGAGITGLNANSLASGVIPDERLAANVERIERTLEVTGARTFAGRVTINNSLTVNGSSGVVSDRNLDSQQGAFAVGRADNPFKYLYMGYDAGDYAYLQPVHIGAAWKNLALNPIGGNVGIGTVNPVARLDVTGPAHGAGGPLANVQGWWLSWSRTGYGELNFINHRGLGPGGIVFEQTSDGVGLSRLMTIDGSGRVGIGVENPTNKLQVWGLEGVSFGSGSAGTYQTIYWRPGTTSWSFTSDRHSKERFAQIDSADILEKVSRLPLAEWSYIGYPQRHIGPMAQDFHKEFPFNEDDKTLNDADLHGVALAAIQGLNKKVKDKEGQIEALKQQCEVLMKRVEDLEAKLSPARQEGVK